MERNWNAYTISYSAIVNSHFHSLSGMEPARAGMQNLEFQFFHPSLPHHIMQRLTSLASLSFSFLICTTTFLKNTYFKGGCED